MGNNSKYFFDSSKKNGLYFKELFNYKDLFYSLAWREFKVRYAQTFLGFIWAVIQPLATLLIFFFIFGKAIKVDTGNIPYPLFALSGLAAWSYFSFVISTSGRSIINESGMIKKIFFPRLVIPFSKALVGLIDFAISLVLLFLAMFYYKESLTWNLLFMPIFLFLILLISVGVGIWISALSLRYRDVQHIIPFFIQIGLYATPVAYSANEIPEKYQLIYHLLNPMAGIIEGFRWSLMASELNLFYLFYSFILVLCIFISSIFYFMKIEKIMADIL